jgi:chemotaxis protein CheY-P-specific phosphatase CheC
MKTLSEVGNIFFNGIMGAFSNVIKKGITYMAPSYRDGRLKELILSGDSDSNYTIFYGQTHYQIEDLKVAGNMVLFFKVDPLETLLAEIDRASQ